MSAEEEDTFDIDLYGDETEQDQLEEAAPEVGYEVQTDTNGNHETVSEEISYDGVIDESTAEPREVPALEQAASTDQSTTAPIKSEPQGDSPQSSTPQANPPQQGTKRKAPSEEPTRPNSASKSRPFDPMATAALKVTELNWWNTEEDLRSFCARAGVEHELREVSFAEHKINGKARGEAYLEFGSPQAATAVKHEVEKNNTASSEESKGTPTIGKKLVLGIQFERVGNSFKTPPNNSGAGGKQGGQFGGGRGGREGAYERSHTGSQRGNFGGRGGFSNQNRGGGYNNMNSRPQAQQQQQQQGGWNAGGGGMMHGGNMGGYAANPMMGMFQQMGRGGMMGNPMMNGRGGGYGGMGNMSMPNMMNQRGGMLGGMNMGMGNMMGRGGWGGGGGLQGGMQQGYGGGQGYQGGGSPMQQQGSQHGNKRAKME